MSAWQQLHVVGVNQRAELCGTMGHDVHSCIVEHCQQTWLLSCLRRNQDTVYGQEYDFKNINSVREYREQVPLVYYDDLAPLIHRIAEGETDVLFAGVPILFERTSGSSGGSKLIPYTENSLMDFQSAILPWLADVVQTYGLSQGKAYWAISPATRAPESTGGGFPVGTSDGVYLGNDAIGAFLELSAVPFWVAELSNVDEWRLATLYYLVREKELALISVWSPTFFITLLDGLDKHLTRLATLLESGGAIAGHELEADPEAFTRLQIYVGSVSDGQGDLRSDKGDLRSSNKGYLKDDNRDSRILWPNLKLVSCWGDASSEPFFKDLIRQFPQSEFQRKGLLATEGVITIPDAKGQPMLTCHSGFYEFLDAEENSFLAHELQLGECYQAVITTSGGLYRYCMGDYLLCESEPREGRAPILRFVGRRGLVSDLVGEKLTEDFVTRCLESVSGFRLLTPNLKSNPRLHYSLLISESNGMSNTAILEQVENRLNENPQYSYARRIGQLGPLDIIRVQNPLETYIKWACLNGTRLGDIKIPSLRPEMDWLTAFTDIDMDMDMDMVT